jgi:hypothetical protein
MKSSKVIRVVVSGTELASALRIGKEVVAVSSRTTPDGQEITMDVME